MLGQRRRRCPNIGPTLGQCLVFAWTSRLCSIPPSNFYIYFTPPPPAYIALMGSTPWDQSLSLFFVSPLIMSFTLS